MPTKRLNHRAIARKGAETTNARYSPELRATWSKKGGEYIKMKYGPNYFKEIRQKGIEKARLAKEQQAQLDTESTS